MALAPLNDPRGERIAAEWKATKRRLRVWLVLPVLPALALIWGAGYGSALLDKRADCIAANTTRKD